MRTLALLTVVVLTLGVSAQLGAVAFEPPDTPPEIVGQGRNAGFFIKSPGKDLVSSSAGLSLPEAGGQATGTMDYVDIPTICVIYTDYYYTEDVQVHLSSADVDVVISEIEKAREFLWRASGMKCHMKNDYLIIGASTGGRTLTPDMMWDWAGDGGHWLPFWSCDGGATSVELDLYNAGIVDGQYSVVLVSYAFENCDEVFAPIGGGTYGVTIGCMGDAAYIGDPMAWGLEMEGVTEHEYLHALDSIFEESGNPLGNDMFHADHAGDFPYAVDCGQHFNFMICRILEPISWTLLFTQWAEDHTAPDADEDGVPDSGSLPITEATLGTSTSDTDSDDDGLSDLDEIIASFHAAADPLNPDTDGDGFADGIDAYPLWNCNDHVGEGTPTVDAVIDTGEYTKAAEYNPGDPDLGVTVYTRWSSGVLYVAADVDDDLIVANDPNWDDSLQIHVDAQKDGWPFMHGNQNYRLIIMPTGPGGNADVTGHNYYEDTDPWHVIDTSAITAKYAFRTGGYIIELSIPQSVMPGMTIAEGETVRMTFSVRDYDTWPGWPLYNLMSKLDDDRPGFVLLYMGPREYYVNGTTGNDTWNGLAAEWDGTYGPTATIQACVDAAMDPAIINVARGTYAETVELADDLWLAGAGEAVTTIDSQNAGEAVLCDGVAGGHVAGFTLTTSGTTYTALRSVGSTVTVRDCIATGSRSGFGAGSTSSLTIENCMALDNSHQGVWQDGSADVTVRNTTIAGNGDNGVVRWGGGMVTLTDTIITGNTDDIDGLVSGFDVDCCCIGDGDFAGSNGNISADPLFVSGLMHDYYLSQTAAGQGSDSPCVDAGSDTAANLGLDGRATRTDGVNDSATVDMGYHGGWPLWIADVYWDQATTSVVITFASEAGVDYTLESADADAYSDAVSWSDLTAPLTAAGALTTMSDNLSTNPLSSGYRFYRVKRSDESDYGWQTAAVCELDLPVGFAVRRFFVSTPLEPDPDHAGVQYVLSTQLNYTNVKLDRLTADTGLYTRATYSPGGGWVNTFSVAAGEAYMLDVGDALPFPHTLRLTGYVPSGPLTVSVTRASFAVTTRWMAYSMPRATTLGALGLETAITPFWDSGNMVRLLPLGATVWSSYRWDGAKWYNMATPSVDAGGTPIACGEGILFIHNGIPAQPDTLTWPTWYLNPPNAW